MRNRWYVAPERVDVILHPREWRFKLHARCLTASLTGHYGTDGQVIRDWVRLGPAPADPAPA